MKTLRYSLPALVLALALSPFSGAFADNENARKYYDEYIKSYGEFKQSVEQNLDEKIIGRYSEKYKEALEKYKNALNGKDSGAEAGTRTGNEASGTQKSAAETSGDANSVSVSKMPESVDDLAKMLHSPGAIYRIDEIITKLEKISRNESNPAEAVKAKIELANAYSKFKNDNDKAAALLQEAMAAIKSGAEFDGAKRAFVRAKFLQYKNALEGMITVNRKDATDLKAAYEAIKWTNPIAKIKAMTAYKKALFDYRKAITIYKSYNENGEKKENYTSFEFLTDLTGKRPEFGIGDTFDNAFIKYNDAAARVKLLPGNNDAWYARWSAINNAKSTIDITYFIIKDDAFGKSLYGLLVKKAREGVKIRLMVDDRGDVKSTVLPTGLDYLQELAIEKNIEVKLFNPLISSAIPSILRGIKNVTASNHQKILLVDGNICVTGGRNIAYEYLAAPEDNPPTIFRDTDVIIESEEVGRALQAAFDFEFNGLEVCKKVKPDTFGNWVSRERELLKSAESMHSWISGGGLVNDKSLKEVNEELSTYKHMVNYNSFEPFKNADIAPVKIFSKSSYQQENDEISDNIMAFMDASSDEIIIQNPYVVLTEKAKAAIRRASARGVKVVIHTNSPASDNQIMSQAFFLDDDWMEFMKSVPNARIFVFTDKVTLHAKVFVFDHVVSVVGTYNMDYISEQINCENVCVVKSEVFTKECRDRIMEDISLSKEYKIGIDKDGKPYEIFGPGNFLKGNKKVIMEYLRKIKVLRPLI